MLEKERGNVCRAANRGTGMGMEIGEGEGRGCAKGKEEAELETGYGSECAMGSPEESAERETEHTEARS